MLVNLKRGSETLCISREIRKYQEKTTITVERKDDKGRVVARNYFTGTIEDAFNLRAEAWKNGWFNA
jgi:hypothetical protein